MFRFSARRFVGAVNARRFLSEPGLAAAIVSTAVLLPGCSDDPEPLIGPLPSPVTDARVEANANNALALDVTFIARGVDMARVRYRVVEGMRGRAGEGTDETTPYMSVRNGEISLPVLGLFPETDYELEIEAMTSDGFVTTGTMTAETGALPGEVASITLDTTEGTRPDRLLLTSVDSHAVVFDGSGRVVWYRHIDGLGQKLIDPTGTGTFVAFVGNTRGWDATFGYFVEVSPSGELLDRHLANAPLYTDNHEILFTTDGDGGISTHYFSYDIRDVDMTPYGGPASARVAGHQLLRFGPGGGLEFMWNAWDHFDIGDWEVAVPSPEDCFDCDFDHPNSLDFDADGNYVVSHRSLNEVTCIEPRVGTVLWRLGGQNSGFRFVDDPLDGFSGQHTARVLDNGNVLIFDNGPNHDPPVSRAVEYALDEGDSTATLAWSYVADPPIYSAFRSSIQRLDDGNTLVAFATGAHVHEVEPDGTVVWKANLNVDGAAAGFYRVIEISSLYDPRRGGPTPAALLASR